MATFDAKGDSSRKTVQYVDVDNPQQPQQHIYDEKLDDNTNEEKKQTDQIINKNYISEHQNLKDADTNTHYVFFYGSCTPKSILEDQQCTPIESYAAIIPGYVRYFARYSWGWKGATASLRKATEFDKPYDSVSGWIAKITDDDLYAMDGREGHPYVYRREYVTAHIYLSMGNKTHIIELDNVYTYFIVKDIEWKVPPTYSYASSCCQTIQYFWKYNNQIVVRNNKYPIYEINEHGKASKMLIFDYFPNLNKTVLRHSSKFDGVKASQSLQHHWTEMRECIRCENETWVCFVDDIALFICDPCKKYFGIKEK